MICFFFIKVIDSGFSILKIEFLIENFLPEKFLEISIDNKIKILAKIHFLKVTEILSKNHGNFKSNK
jgi:hypothetical protein